MSFLCRSCEGRRLQRSYTIGNSKGSADVGDAAAPVAAADDALFAVASLGMGQRPIRAQDAGLLVTGLLSHTRPRGTHNLTI